MSKVNLDWKTATDFCTDAFMKVGVPKEDAEICTDILLEADRRGIESHGCNRFKPIYMDRIKIGIQNPKTNFEIIKETETTAVVDGHDGMGQVIGYKAMKLAIDKAKKHGMGMVVVRNSCHYGIAGYYGTMASKAGCISINGTNARPSVAPTFGVEGMFGTNPLTIGIPSDEKFDFLIDCATSITQNGKIEYYARQGGFVLPGTIIDNNGNLVTGDAGEALKKIRNGTAALTPLGGIGEELGGYKGYGYAVAVEILSAALQDGQFGKALNGLNEKGEKVPYHLGHFFIAIDTDHFLGEKKCRQITGDILRKIRASKKQPGHDRIYTAGEKEWLTWQKRKDTGVPINPSVQQEMNQIRDELKLNYVFPWEKKFKYVCNDCGKEFVTERVIYECKECAKKNNIKEFRYGNLNVEINEEYLKSLSKKKNINYEDFFVYEIPNKDCYPVGPTPICKPYRLQKKLGLQNLFFKLDSQLPSGSFKDRATQLVIAQALSSGEKKIALASTGNAGAATCCGGAAYGLEIVLFVPQSAPINKLMQSVLYGANVIPVKGTYDDAFALSIEYTKKFGGINRNTAYNPMTIEGKKSVSIEIFEQLNRNVPDIFYVPVGDGCIISGVAKGFYDLKKAGLINKLPHLVCVQSELSSAITDAFLTNKFVNLKEAPTRADSISVESPAAGRTAVMRLKECEGWCVKVKDEEILNAQLELAKESGVFVEPAAATAYAGLLKDYENIKNKYGNKVNVGCLLTGTAFKDMKVFEGKCKIPDPIENNIEAMIKHFSK